MIPYEDLERALARWKAKTHGNTPDVIPAGGADDRPRAPGGSNGARHSSELSGEIDINELVESYED
jgi:hypothetical protein